MLYFLDKGNILMVSDILHMYVYIYKVFKKSRYSWIFSQVR